MVEHVLNVSWVRVISEDMLLIRAAITLAIESLLYLHHFSVSSYISFVAMDIAASVYREANVDVPPRPDIYIDEEAELKNQKPCPFTKPRLLECVAEGVEDESSLQPASAEESLRRKKHESYDLSGSVFLVTQNGKTLNLPVASDSEHDPLNWSRWKFAGAFLALVWFSSFSATSTQAAALMMPGIARDLGQVKNGPWTMETLVTAPTLFMGIGAFFWVPLSLALGRRPAFLLATSMNFAATLAAAYSGTFNELLGCICLMGFSEGFGLSVTTLMVIDMTYIHQRMHAIACLWALNGFFAPGFSAVVPSLSGHGLDWRAFYRTWSLLAGIAVVLAYLLGRESYFKRPTVAFNGLILLQTATEKLTVHEDQDKDSELYRDLPEFPFDNPDKQTILQRIGLARSVFASFKSSGRCVLQIMFCIANPLLFWVFIAASFNFAGMMFIGATFPRILSAPPYLLSPYIITNVNLASACGSFLSYVFGGCVTANCLKRLAKRNNGVREAEHYLICFIPAVITGGLSTLIYGLAVNHTWNIAAYYLAYGLNGFSWISISVGIILWVTEAFPRWAAPAIAAVNGGCYLLSFSMSFALVPWIERYGYLTVGIHLMVLQLVGGLIAVPIAFWGKNARQVIHGRWANERSGALRPL
ncbi:unnamed protein product [Periconia digitata]|uniref:Major facilitator superfamily (MFS) profile domain-containing protein n=1 Tax=Periconia digitata TaxID=1303443 RepID=A0A9W4URK7_9PLEO|nr:unnamed protein product [Periconia digitata]